MSNTVIRVTNIELEDRTHTIYQTMLNVVYFTINDVDNGSYMVVDTDVCIRTAFEGQIRRRFGEDTETIWE